MFVYRSMTLTAAMFACLFGLTVQAIAQTPTPTPGPSEFQEAQPELRALLPTYDEADVVETGTGLQVVVLEEGEGEALQKCDVVQTHYTAYLADGTEFDTSSGRPPFSFVLGTNQVITGWDEGIALLRPGARAILMIPPDLGYGANAVNNLIPGNSTLYFDMEVVGVDRATQPATIETVETMETVTTLDNGITYETIITGTQPISDDQVIFLEYMLWEAEGCMVSATVENEFIISYQPSGDQVITPIISGTTGIELGEVRQIFWPAAVMDNTGFNPISYTVEVTAVNAFPAPPDTPATISITEYITTEQGVRYTILKEGTGDEIANLQTLNLFYMVWSAEGEFVYSSLFSGRETIDYTVGRNEIPGFDEGLRNAKVGEVRQVIIPAGVAPPDARGVSNEVIIQMELMPDIVLSEEPSAVGFTSQNIAHTHLPSVLIVLFTSLSLLSMVKLEDSSKASQTI